MRSVKVVGLALMAVLAFSAVAASTAAAEEFITNDPGGKITGKALNNQVFVAKSGGAEVICKSATPEGTAAAERTEKQEVEVNYTNCEVAGIEKASISKAFYIFIWNLSTSKWSVGVITHVIEILTLGAIKCHINVFIGQLFDLGIGFKNTTSGTGKKSIIAESNVSGIESEVTESGSTLFCGKVGEKNTTGTYKGNVESEIEGAGHELEVK